MFDHYCDCKLSMKTIMLFWPLHIIHQLDYDTDDRDCESGEQHEDCFMLPVTAPVNFRDVAHSRISSVRCNQLLLRNTQAHAVFGKVVKSDKYSDVELSGNPISSIFDRYSICKFDGSKSYFDMTDVICESDRKKISNFVESLSINTALRPLPPDALEKIAKASSFVELMTYFTVLLNQIYAGFALQSAFQKLDRCIDSLIHNELYQEKTIADCIKNTGIELKAMYRFQQYMFPTCISLMDGNHRHLLVLLHEYIKDKSQFIVGEGMHGYKIMPSSDVNDESNCLRIDMNYSFYRLSAEEPFMDLPSIELQKISKRQNMILQHSICEESCH
jgi:hypothetical protein